MISEAIDFRFLLLENYKKLQIREDELAVIFMIDHLITIGTMIENNAADFVQKIKSFYVSKMKEILSYTKQNPSESSGPSQDFQGETSPQSNPWKGEMGINVLCSFLPSSIP